MNPVQPANPSLSAGVRAHYRDFYDPDPAADADDRPVLAVVGNCQAEALRMLVDAGESGDVRTVRLPAVHEWTEHDLVPLGRLLERLDLLVAQPVGVDYRGLPVGTEQLVDRLRPSARHVLVPAVRYAGLQPTHVVVHPPGLADPDPPIAAYHDVRLAARAAELRAGGPAPTASDPGPAPAPGLTPEVVRWVGAESLAELRRREVAHATLRASDLLMTPTFASMRTVNHPGNAVLAPLAARVRAALGLEARPPGVSRPVLAAVHAPREAAVAEVFEPDAEATDHWLIEGRPVPAVDVARAQLEWYAARPDVLDVVLERTRELRERLGLVP